MLLLTVAAQAKPKPPLALGGHCGGDSAATASQVPGGGCCGGDNKTAVPGGGCCGGDNVKTSRVFVGNLLQVNVR